MYVARKYKKCHDKTMSVGKINKLNDNAYFFTYRRLFIKCVSTGKGSLKLCIHAFGLVRAEVYHFIVAAAVDGVPHYNQLIGVD